MRVVLKSGRLRAVRGASRALWLGACLAGLAAGASGQSFSGWDRVRDEGFVFDPDRSEVATFAILTSAEVRHLVARAEAALSAGREAEAFEPLQRLIDEFPFHLYQVGPDRWVGAAEYARFLLTRLSPEGRSRYAEWARLRVAPAWRRARASRRVNALLDLIAKFPLGEKAADAARVASDLEAERGRFDLAYRVLLRRLALEPGGTGEDESLARAALAARVCGKDAAAARLAGRVAGEVRLRGEMRPARAILDEVEGWHTPPPEPWPTLGGREDRNGFVADGGRPVRLRDRWWASAFSRPELNPYVRARSDLEYPFHAVAAGDTIVLTDGLSVTAFPPFSNDPRWTFRGPLFDPANGDGFYRFEDYAPSASGPLGSLARSLPLAATVAEGRVLASLIEPTPRGRRISFDKTDITIPIPRRALYCLDLTTGRLLWRQSRPALGPQAFVNRLSVPAPPVVVGDRVYAVGYVLEGAINLYALCFSLADGSLVWKTPVVVGQQELTMFNKAFKEFTVQAPAERDGDLLLCTNLGLFACVDALSGQPRWVMRYDSIPIRGSLHYTQPRERSTTSANDPPVVTEDTVVFYPFDSNFIYAVDRHSGKLKWRVGAYSRGSRPTRYAHVLGVDRGVVILSGRYGVGFLDLATGETLGRYTFGVLDGAYPKGRGCLAPGVVYQPLSDRLLVLRHRRTSFGVEIEAESHRWDPEVAGNFVRLPDVDVVVSRSWISGFYDLESLIAQARERAASPSASAADFLLLGELEVRRGDFKAGLEALRRAEAKATRAKERARARAGIFRCHDRLATLADSAGDEEGVIQHLRAQLEYAADDHDFLATAEKLVDLLEKRGEWDRLLELLALIEEKCARTEYPFTGWPEAGLLPTAIFVEERRAEIFLALGQPERAVASWQRMIESFGDRRMGAETVADHAARRIGDVIARYGRGVYERFEQEAERLHAEAVRRGDAELLARVIRRFPNSANVTRFRIDYGRMLLDARRTAGLFETLGPLLEESLDPPERAEVLMLLARGAEAVGDFTLARRVWQRLLEEGPLSEAGPEGLHVREIARSELERLERSLEEAAPAMWPRTLPGSPPVSIGLDLSDDTRLIAVRGAPPPGGEGALLFERERTPGGGDHGSLRMFRLASHGSEVLEVWRAPVDPYFHEGDPLAAWWIGDRLVVRQSRTFRGYEAADGRKLFEFTLPRVPLFTRHGGGLLYVVWTRPDGATMLGALESASGSFFWKRKVDGVLEDVEVTDDLVLLLSDDHRVTALDGLTGRVRYVTSLLDVARGLEIEVFEPLGLFVATGGGREASSGRIVAFHLRDGLRLWQRDGLSPRVTSEWVQAAIDESGPPRLVLLHAFTTVQRGARAVVAVDVLDPKSGRLILRVDDLPHLSAMEDGPVVVGRKVVLVEEARRRRLRRPQPTGLFVIDVDSGDKRRTALARLGEGRYVDFRAVPTADGRLVGTIDTTEALPGRGSQSMLFRFDPFSLAFEVERIPSRFDVFRAMLAPLPDALVVLKDDRLFFYPCPDREER